MVEKLNKKEAWNKGRVVGQKRAFSPAEISMIRSRLIFDRKFKQIALLNFAIDSMLRSIDVRSVRLSDIKNSLGEYRDKFSVKQQKTGVVVVIRLSKATIDSIKHYVAVYNLIDEDKLFGFSHSYYAFLVKKWAETIGLPREDHATHSMRRTKPAHIYEETKNLGVIMKLLGHTTIGSTGEYLDITSQDALDLARKYEI